MHALRRISAVLALTIGTLLLLGSGAVAGEPTSQTTAKQSRGDQCHRSDRDDHGQGHVSDRHGRRWCGTYEPDEECGPRNRAEAGDELSDQKLGSHGHGRYVKTCWMSAKRLEKRIKRCEECENHWPRGAPARREGEPSPEGA